MNSAGIALRGTLSRWRGRMLLFALLASLTAGLMATSDAEAAYAKRKKITIDRTKVGNSGAPATLTDYPFLYSVTDLDLRHTSSGGKVQRPEGYDITFRGADGSTVLAHEIEEWNSTTGKLVAWVKIPSLNTISAGSDTFIYVYYSDSTVTSSTQNPTAVWNANYKGVWHLKEATGVTNADSTTNANNGTPTNGPVGISTGQIGRALDFDGVDDYVNIPDPANGSLDFGSTGNFSISLWVRPNGTQVQYDRLLNKHAGSPIVNFPGYMIFFDTNNAYGPTISDGGGGNCTDDTCVLGQQLGTVWNHLVMVVDRTNARIRSYRNGVLDQDAAIPGTVGNIDTTSPLRFAASGDGTRASNIELDEVRILNTAVTAHWIKTEYNNTCACVTFATTGPEESSPGAFNAFETNTAANEVYGVVKTKVAGVGFSLDVVRVDGFAQLTSFSGAVTVELLGNNTLGVALDANNCPTSFTTVQTVSPNPTITSGRSTVSFAAVADSWRDVRVRVRYPTSSPTLTACSTDNFAIRPNTFASFSATDGNWETAGTGRTLNSTAATGGTIHKAGRPFTVRATAVNGAGTPATTVNYTGTPTPTVSDCGASTACPSTLGSLTLGASFAAGVLNTTTASYSEVGSLALQLVDSDFASVDAADGSTTTERNITSSTINVGRFVPDHFIVSSPGKTIYSTGSYSFTVPAGVTSITVKAWGAGGGGGGGGSAAIGGHGGGGGYATSTLSVTPGETLDIVIGGGGAGGTNASTGGDGGGGGGGGATVAGGGVGRNGCSAGGSSGGGGGYSAVKRGATFLVEAAGGGGGGGGSNGASETGGAGGAGGGTNGVSGSSGGAGGAGGGGGQAGSGGTGGNTGSGGGNGAAGSANTGGAGGTAAACGSSGTGGGGGGAGRYGGGGGGGDDDGAGGGGGGSGLGSTLTAGSGQTSGNNADADYAGSAGLGGTRGASGGGNATAGNPGRIVLSYDGAMPPFSTASFSTACSAGSTYIGQAFTYATAPVITVTAQNFANGTTANYTGALWKITNASLTGKSYTSAAGTLDTSGIPGTDPVIEDIVGGSGKLRFSSGTGLFFTRSTPVAPFDADISLAINVIDGEDGSCGTGGSCAVAYANNPVRFGEATAGNGIAFSSGKSMRFGRLALRNASGSQLVPLPLQMEAQYWAYINPPTNTVLGFITNAADSCTTFATNNIAMSGFSQNLSACETAISSVSTLSSGRGTVILAKPGNANNGSVNLTVNLAASASGTTCTSVGGGTVAAAGANRTYLQGNWTGASYDQNPTARATMGVYRGSDDIIYVRENF